MGGAGWVMLAIGACGMCVPTACRPPAICPLACIPTSQAAPSPQANLGAAAGRGDERGVDPLDPAAAEHQGHVGGDAHQRVHSLWGRAGTQ